MILVLLSLIATSLVFACGFVLGRFWHRVMFALGNLNDAVVTLMRRSKPEPQESTGAVIMDPDDPVQRAKFEREEMSRRLNR